MNQRVVRAAGAVVWRSGADGRREIAVVHRPKYDDWSLPKGKLDPGEDDRAAAVREVAEETGAVAEVTADLGSVSYAVRSRGRPAQKVVRYYVMHASASPAFTPNDEIDALRWVDVDTAESLVSYDLDRDVLGRYRAAEDVGA